MNPSDETGIEMSYYLFTIDWSQTVKQNVIVKAESSQQAADYLNVEHLNKDTWPLVPSTFYDLSHSRTQHLPSYISYMGSSEVLIEL